MLLFDILEECLDLLILRCNLVSILGVLEGALQLGFIGAFRHGEHSLCHPVIGLCIFGLVLEDFLTLLHHIVILLQVELAKREVSSACNLNVLCSLVVFEVKIAPEDTDCRLILLAGFFKVLVFEKLVSFLFKALSFVNVLLLFVR